MVEILFLLQRREAVRDLACFFSRGTTSKMHGATYIKSPRLQKISNTSIVESKGLWLDAQRIKNRSLSQLDQILQRTFAILRLDNMGKILGRRDLSICELETQAKVEERVLSVAVVRNKHIFLLRLRELGLINPIFFVDNVHLSWM